jgi:hypothetical protein
MPGSSFSVHRGLTILSLCKKSIMKYSSSELLLTAARVAVGSPDYCHRLLIRLGEELKEEGASAAELVVYGTAIRRKNPLIDLAVAQYSPKASHVRNCFMRTLARLPNTLQRSYQMGLRLACLQNQRGFPGEGRNPTSYLGKGGAAAFLRVATNDELLALFTNPAIDEELVEALYRRAKPFSDIAPGKWASMLVYCMDNPRLQQCRSTGEKTDSGHDRIHRAIWWFVEHAPFNDILAQIILNTLVRLNPEQVYLPNSIDATLDRWGQLGLRKGSKAENTLTGLTRQEELRCLIASLYGKKTGALSDATESSPDIAHRCCYYANARLNSRQIRAGYERDAGAFLLAAVGNVGILLNRDKSAVLEQYLGDDWLTHRYLRIREALHHEWGSASPDPVTDRLMAVVSRSRSQAYRIARGSADAEERHRQRRITENELLASKLETLGKGVRSMAAWLLAALAAIATLIWLK